MKISGDIKVIGDLDNEAIKKGHSTFTLVNGALIAAIGGFSVNVSVQSAPILLVAMQSKYSLLAVLVMTMTV